MTSRLHRCARRSSFVYLIPVSHFIAILYHAVITIIKSLHRIVIVISDRFNRQHSTAHSLTHTHARARVHTYTLTHLEVRMQLMASSHCSHQTIQSVAKWNHWIDRRISFISIRLLTCKPTRKSTIKLAPKWAWNTTDWLTSRLGSWIGSWLQNRLKSWR